MVDVVQENLVDVSQKNPNQRRPKKSWLTLAKKIIIDVNKKNLVDVGQKNSLG